MKKNIVETKQWLDKHYPNSAPSRQMVEKWIAEFKRGRTSTKMMKSAVDAQMRLLFQKT